METGIYDLKCSCLPLSGLPPPSNQSSPADKTVQINNSPWPEAKGFKGLLIVCGLETKELNCKI